MRFIMFVCPSPSFSPSASLESDTDAWVKRWDDQGVRLIGDVLEDEAAGITVGDGPPSPTVAIAGFDVLECRDLDHAREVVSEHPMAQLGSIVVRPVMVF